MLEYVAGCLIHIVETYWISASDDALLLMSQNKMHKLISLWNAIDYLLNKV